MGPRPEGCTLDRKDNAGPYSPENCVWSPRKVQERNKRTNRLITVFGRTMTVAEAAEAFDVKTNLYQRLNRGMSPEEAVSLPLSRRGGDRRPRQKSA